MKQSNRQMTIDKWTDILIEMLDEVEQRWAKYWIARTCGHCKEFFKHNCKDCPLHECPTPLDTFLYCTHGLEGLEYAKFGEFEPAIEHVLMLLDGVEL